MVNPIKRRKVKAYDVNKELAKVDKVFRSIKNDKTLPTFGNFFMLCLIQRTAENVNLKMMYPRVYKKLNTLLEDHDAKILLMRQ